MTLAAPLVSCVVPAFNSERYLHEALDSIDAQTYRPIEIIVADDGSTDGTAEIVSRYRAPVRFVTQATAGPAATRNLGLRAARSDLIAFLDADDRWHPEKLARQVERFATRPELAVSVTHIQNFWIHELQEEARRLRDHARTHPMPGYVTMTMMVRRETFERVGPFDESLWHTDAGDWFLRAAQQGAVIELLPEVLVSHRMHHGNLSRRYGPSSRAEFVRLVKRSLDARRAGGTAADVARHLSAFSNAGDT
jgi:glycosyltransferase involved in cell wall biosynthesis